MTFRVRAFGAALLAGLLAAASAARAEEEVTLFAAASMTDALTELAAAFTAAGGPPVKLAFASSSTLAKQIESGAPADLFVAADLKWMDYLAERDLVVEASRQNLAGNALVLVAPLQSTLALQPAQGFDLAGALGDDRLALGDPEHVPAGRYAKAALEHLGVWAAVEPKTVFAGDVRAALAFVEQNEVAAGIVYATDAAISGKVKVIGAFPGDSHDPVVYPIAILAGHDRPAVAAFLAFLLSEAAAELLRGYGFVVPAPTA